MKITNQADAWIHLQKLLRKGHSPLQLKILRIEHGQGNHWQIFWESDPPLYGAAPSYIVYASGRITDPRDGSVVFWEV